MNTFGNIVYIEHLCLFINSCAPNKICNKCRDAGYCIYPPHPFALFPPAACFCHCLAGLVVHTEGENRINEPLGK